MKKYYQTKWQGISFNSFAEPDDKAIAGPAFYESFYQELFRRYKSWDALDPQWLATKRRIADHVFSRLPGPTSRVLSIGCGLGAVEKRLLERGRDNLDVTETSAQPLQWLRQIIGDDQVFIGLFPACLPADRRYGLIYLSSVDYCFDGGELAALLGDIRGRLEKGGRCLVISSSFDPGSVCGSTKFLIRAALAAVGIGGSRGQLWGYLRTSKDYRVAMANAGFSAIECGLLPNNIFWIEGKNLD